MCLRVYAWSVWGVWLEKSTEVKYTLLLLFVSSRSIYLTIWVSVYLLYQSRILVCILFLSDDNGIISLNNISLLNNMWHHRKPQNSYLMTLIGKMLDVNNILYLSTLMKQNMIIIYSNWKYSVSTTSESTFRSWGMTTLSLEPHEQIWRQCIYWYSNILLP